MSISIPIHLFPVLLIIEFFKTNQQIVNNFIPLKSTKILQHFFCRSPSWQKKHIAFVYRMIYDLYDIDICRTGKEVAIDTYNYYVVLRMWLKPVSKWFLPAHIKQCEIFAESVINICWLSISKPTSNIVWQLPLQF